MIIVIMAELAITTKMAILAFMDVMVCMTSIALLALISQEALVAA